MTITYTYHPKYDLVVARLSGTIDEEELLSSYRHIYYDDPRIKPGHNELTDGRELKSVKFTGTSLVKLVTMGKAFHGDKRDATKVAHLVSSDYHIGISNMYEAYANAPGRRTVKAFTDARTALDWLGAYDLTPETMHEPDQ